MGGPWRGFRSIVLAWTGSGRDGLQTRRPLVEKEWYMKTRIAGFFWAFLAFAASAQTPPPPPTLLEPANGAALAQPITLAWNPIVDPDGPIGSYTWQVGTSSTFSTIVAQGFQNMWSEEMPPATREKLSGLPNGTYFWRVSGIQMVGGAVGSIQSGWSEVRSFTVTGLGPAPGIPSITSPANASAFHPFEFFDITWTPVPGAQYYLLEADDQPSFSHPLTLTTEAMQFGTKFRAGWGNEIPDIYYRVRAVSVDNVRGLPSPTLNVRVVNTAPTGPAPTPLSPVGGASITIPFIFDWTDTANPQVPAYDLDIDNEPNFQGAVGVLLVQGVSRSDYMVVEDPLLEGRNIFPPGQYFWRVRALHGNVAGPWSATGTFNVVASPSTPPGVELFHLINEPGSVSGGNPTQSRVTLNQPAGPGGALIKIASDMPNVESPTSVFIPEGKTDGWVSPITTVPVRGATIGNTRAAYAGKWQQSSLGLWQILYGLSLSAESVIGGETVVGTITLLDPAPPGGVEVTIVSRDTSLVTPPAKVFIPAGEFGATFNIATAPVSAQTRVVIDCGTAFEGYRAPENWLNLLPAGSPPASPSLASLSLASSSIVGGGTTTGTLTLTRPAPPGGASVWLNGSMEGQVVTPGPVTIPAGSLSADFTITAPQVNARHYVLIQARYGSFGGTHAKLLEVRPPAAGTPTLLALDVRPRSVIGGQSTRGMVSLVMPAPAGGATVALSTSDPALAQVPPTVTIAPGNSANSFEITTGRVFLQGSVRIDASAGGVTKSFWMDLGSDPNAPPLLQSVTLNPNTVPGGSPSTGTVFLSAPALAGGITITLATSSSVATAPGIVSVAGGQTSANFTVTTRSVSSSTPVTVTAFYDTTRSATLTVTSGSSQPPAPGTPTLSSPANGATVSQPVTLDWGNVANAATYEIQVDDSSGFSIPLVQSLTSTASAITVNGLAPVQHWWRVRARNSAGAAGNWSSSRRFTPQGAPAPASLSSVSLSPSSVAGGNSAQGTVTLTSAAPSGGASISLSSSSTSATTPSTVTIPAGATSANFVVSTLAVPANTSATITAIYNSVSRTATLTLTPPSSGPLPAPSLVTPASDARFSPGQNITFDWSDVSGAANYTIQIDDSNTFSAPYIVNQNTTGSTFSSSSLPTRRMWWRARANDSSGTAGAWSSVRRFEVKD